MKRSNILAIILICVLSFTYLWGDASEYQKKLSIFDAIHSRDVAAINDIINADPTVLDSKTAWGIDTPLNYALRWRSPQMAQAILDHHPDVSVRDRQGLLPVHILVQMHSVKMLEQLVALGADIYSTDTFENGDALYWAAAGGNIDAMQYLLAKGLDINQGKPDGRKPLNKVAQCGYYKAFLWMIGKGASLPNTDISKGLLFQDAVAGGSLDIIKYLINLGYDPNQTTSENGVPIFSALYSKTPDALLSYLIDQGADINQLNKEGSSLLLEAIKLHKDSLIRLLIESGANPNKADKEGLTPFFLAASEYPSALQFMLDYGVDINQRDKYGDTALLISVISDSLASMQTLIGNKADLNLQNKNGQTALILACQIQNVEKVYILIKAGSDLKKKDVNGRNALHNAVLNGNPDLVTALVDAGADLNDKDRDGYTALDYALKYAHPDIAKLLKSKHAQSQYKDASQAMEQIDFSHDNNVTGVWFLGDSGIAVRTGQNLLIFDYLKHQAQNINPSLYTNPGVKQAPANPSLYNGWINPEEIKDLNVYVFVTNRTMDPLHKDKRILELKDRIPNVKYVIGFNTQPGWQSYMYPELPRYYPNQGSETDSNGVSVTPITYMQGHSFDFGYLIGYCVKVNEVTIWYTGSFFNKSDSLSVDFRTGVNNLSEENPVVDLAVLPVGLPEMDNFEALKQNSDYFVKIIKPKTIVPVHIASRVIDSNTWSTASPVIDNSIWATAAKAMGYKKQTKLLQNPGDHFIFKLRK